MLVKLAFVMQRLKKYRKNFFMINKDGGDSCSILWGDIELTGGSSSPPPTRENPASGSIKYK